MSDDPNPAHELVAEAYDLMEQTLEQDEITQADIEACKAALLEAIEQPDSDIWVTMVARRINSSINATQTANTSGTLEF